MGGPKLRLQVCQSVKGCAQCRGHNLLKSKPGADCPRSVLYGQKLLETEKLPIGKAMKTTSGVDAVPSKLPKQVILVAIPKSTTRTSCKSNKCSRGAASRWPRMPSSWPRVNGRTRTCSSFRALLRSIPQASLSSLGLLFPIPAQSTKATCVIYARAGPLVDAAARIPRLWTHKH